MGFGGVHAPRSVGSVRAKVCSTVCVGALFCDHAVNVLTAKGRNNVQRSHDAVDMSWELAVLTHPVDFGSVHAMSCSTVRDSAVLLLCGVASVRAITVTLRTSS